MLFFFIIIACDMGFKRPFDEEEFHEFSFKHPKQHDTANKLTSLGENCSPNEASKKSDNTGKKWVIMSTFNIYIVCCTEIIYKMTKLVLISLDFLVNKLIYCY